MDLTRLDFWVVVVVVVGGWDVVVVGVVVVAVAVGLWDVVEMRQ